MDTSEPLELDELWRASAELWAQGKKKEAVNGFEALSRLAREDGDLALAVAAAKKLEPMGAKPRAEALLRNVAQTYAAGSRRVDARLRPSPPAPPRKDAGAGPPPRKHLDPVELVARATERAEEAAHHPKMLPAVAIAHAVDPSGLERLLTAMKLIEREAGDVVIQVGDVARSMFLVARGSLEVTRETHILGYLRPESFFGEIALLSGTTRTARVTCVNDAVLLEIDAGELEAAARRSPLLAETLAAHARHRLLANTMRTSEIFRRLEPAERETLIGRFVPKVHPQGATIVEEGREGERLHVIVSGHLVVERGGVVIADLGPGDVCGEISLIARKPATAGVRATIQSVTLSLDRKSFDDVAMKHPGLLAEVYKLVVEREADQSASSLVVAEEDDLVV